MGPILPNSETIFVATGFNKWGMTNGAAAALALSSRILGGRMDWARAFASWSPHELSGLATAVQANLEVGFNLTKGWVTPAVRIGRRSRSTVTAVWSAARRGTYRPAAASTAPSTACHRCVPIWAAS